MKDDMMGVESDVIFALSTAFGKSGIAVFRVSGKDLPRYFSDLGLGKNLYPRQVKHCNLLNQNRDVIDDVLAVYFQAPHSFTGEDVLEISVHGSLAVIEAVSQRFQEIPGWRMAIQGEFSRRAFRNSKMDLAQAEGLADMLEAVTAKQLQLAQRQAWGMLSEQVKTWRTKVLHLKALAEASIDFSEDLDQDIDDQIRTAASALLHELQTVLEVSQAALKLKRGFSVAIVGPPNAGKSSLLNALMGRKLSIVTEIAGTTRDAVSAETQLKGLPVKFIDTAGLRETSDPIEAMGVDLANEILESADMVVSVAAPGQEFADVPGADIWVRTHADKIEGPTAFPNEFSISSTMLTGIENFKEHIAAFLSKKLPELDRTLFMQERQQGCIRTAIQELGFIAQAPTLDIVGERLRYTAQALGEITGDVDVEDVLDVIFSQFCIGK